MSYNTLQFKNIDELMHIYEHKSGLKCFVIPKKGYMNKHATFSTHYGSINNSFKFKGDSKGDSKIISVPDGIAHFLEHKLFEQKDGNVMDKFTELGANSNAYTSFAQTVYLFSCTDKFHENFDLLLNFVQNPYITEESVEREKKIIGQEIDMYKDDPNWRCFFNLLGAFYSVNTVKIEITGSKESISRIDKDTLYMCYDIFYKPSNMVICVVGDVDFQKVFDQVEKTFDNESAFNYKEKYSNHMKNDTGHMNKNDAVDREIERVFPVEIERVFPVENELINCSYVEEKLAISAPIFQMGFADDTIVTKGIDAVKKEVAVRIVFDMIAGRSSELYSKLYDKGLISSPFEFDYVCEENYSFSCFGGESRDPRKVREEIIEEILEIRKNGLNKEDFERIKKSLYGKCVRQFNSIDRISHNFISSFYKCANLFDYLEVYDKIRFEDACLVFEKHFNIERLALSTILPA